MQLQHVMYLSGAPRIALHSGTDGGPRRHVLGTIAGLEAAGHEVSTFIAGDGLSQRLVGEAGSVDRRRLDVPGMRLLHDLARCAFTVRNRWRMRRALPARAPDLVYERYAMYQRLGPLFQRRGIPWVVESNGIYSRELARRHRALGSVAMAHRHEGATYRACDLLVAVSDALRRDIMRTFDIPGSHIVVVPNGVDAGLFDELPLPAAGQADCAADLVVGYVGKLDTLRRPDILLEAVAEVRRCGLDCRAVFIGDGIGLAALRERRAALGLEEVEVAIHGHVPIERVPALMGTFDVGYCAPVLDDDTAMYTCPLKLYEYMAAGRPVIYSAVPAIAEEIGGREFGFPLAGHSITAVADAIAAVAARRADLARLGREAAHYAREHCTWEVRMRACMAMLRARLGDQARHPQRSGRTL